MRFDQAKKTTHKLNALTHAPRMLSSSSSTALGILWMLTNKVWQGTQQNGPCRSRNCIGESDSTMMSIEAVLNWNQPLKSPKGVYNILHFQTQKLSKPKNCGKEILRVFLDIFRPPDHNSSLKISSSYTSKFVDFCCPALYFLSISITTRLTSTISQRVHVSGIFSIEIPLGGKGYVTPR